MNLLKNNFFAMMFENIAINFALPQVREVKLMEMHLFLLNFPFSLSTYFAGKSKELKA
jgi:hypothetical protein